jgi:hypothetical protein
MKTKGCDIKHNFYSLPPNVSIVMALYNIRLLSNEIAEARINVSTTKPGYCRLELEKRRENRENWRNKKILGYSIDYIQIEECHLKRL